MLRALSSLFLRLDRRAATHLQQQICDGLRGAIAEGVLAPGTRIPSARALASELAVSRTTIVAAQLQLVAEGYLATRARSGTFVADEPPETAPPPRVPPAAPQAHAAVRLSRRADEQAREAGALGSLRRRARAFGLSRPALDAFPVREWTRILSRRAARITAAQLDYNHESPELRTAIAELVSSARGMRVHPEQVMLFSGGQPALEFAFAALLDPGDRAWMEDPGYAGARNALASAGAAVTSVPVDDQGMVVAPAGRARLAYVTPSCQFPLGVVMSLPRRNALLAWAARANACIVEDDYDCEFRHAGAPLPALAALDAAGRVVYVNSFSRTMYPALRLGYLIAPPPLVDRLRAARATREEHLPSLSQLALADFIAEGHFVRHLRRMKVLYRARYQALRDAARATGRMLVRTAFAGLHAIADLDVDAVAVSAAAARRGVEATPLAHFHAGGRARSQALVLGFGAATPERIRTAADALAAAIDEVAQGTRDDT